MLLFVINEQLRTIPEHNMLVETTRLLQQGQVILPEALRNAHKWETGQEFLVLNLEDGVLLKPKPLFAPRQLDEVAGCLRYSGKPKTLTDMENAIAEGVKPYHDFYAE
jgi:bifunctional DNA-binding transcriptional regulator/antitoxin component of YhaV-PrlF toxin-antitoxin module